MSSLDKITKRQKQVLKAIYNSIKDSGYPPTLADLREELKVSSNQAVLDFLKLLEDKGYIKKEEGAARGIKILPKGYAVLNIQPLVPYVGISSAGLYTQAFENIEWQQIGGIQMSNVMLVKIHGDSMIGASINDGDIVVIYPSKEFKNGDIVLARNNDETTVKKLVRENGRTFLKPENPKYLNIPIYPDTRLIGKVVQVIKKN